MTDDNFFSNTDEFKSMREKKLNDFSSSDWVIARWMLIIRPAVVTATLGLAILVLPEGMIDKTTITVVVSGIYILTFLYWLAHYISGVSHLLLATQIAFDIFIITVIDAHR